MIQLGEEPHAKTTGASTIFDWTILERVVESSEDSAHGEDSLQGAVCVAVGFSDWKARIPLSRKKLVQRAIDRRLVQIEQLPKPLTIGGIMRERQATFGDVLITLGGGAGVEHLFELYREMHRPVIPLDIPFCAAKISASERLYQEALERPTRFFEYEPATRGTAALSNLSLVDLPKIENSVSRLVEFVKNLSAPKVFFAHLLNTKLPEYRRVSSFFENVVSEVFYDAGFSRFDPGIDSSDEAFLNVEIFKMIQASSVVVVDLTAMRPNCLLELGFAIGRGKKVVISALDGTQLPFDTSALPCHFWQEKIPDEMRRDALKDFIARNINRRKID